MSVQTVISKKYDELLPISNSRDKRWIMLAKLIEMLNENYNLRNTEINPDQVVFRNDMKIVLQTMILAFDFEYPEQTVGDSDVLNKHGEFIQKINKGIERMDQLDINIDIDHDSILKSIFIDMYLYMNGRLYEMSQTSQVQK